MATNTAENQWTAFEIAGGSEGVRRIVDHFYDLMEFRSDFAKLRELHAEDLLPMRSSLTGFLTAWLGGPRDWFTQHPGVCIMSAHAKLAIDEENAAEWIEAMRQAIMAQNLDPAITKQMTDALAGIAQGMIRRSHHRREMASIIEA